MLNKKWIYSYYIKNNLVEIFKNPNKNDILQLFKDNKNSNVLCYGEIRGYINIHSLNYYVWTASCSLHKDILKKMRYYNEDTCITFIYINDLKILMLNNTNFNEMKNNKIDKIKSILNNTFKPKEILLERF